MTLLPNKSHGITSKCSFFCQFFLVKVPCSSTQAYQLPVLFFSEVLYMYVQIFFSIQEFKGLQKMQN